MMKLNLITPNKPEKLYSGIELVEKACIIDGPTGNEWHVSDFLAEQLYGLNVEINRDRMGNLYAIRKGSGKGYNAEKPMTVMLNAHMDEVGFLVVEVTDKGYIKFAVLGGMDSRILCGRTVRFEGKDGVVKGIICSPAVHNLSADQKKRATKADDMVIDIGAKSKEEALAMLPLGSFGTFDSEFVIFGENNCRMKGKAIDDRAGCTAMIEVLRRLDENSVGLPFDIVCAFTVKEEIGKSGALLAANRYHPGYAIVLETTAIADRPDVNENSRVATVGDGGVMSVADKSTMYDSEIVKSAFEIADKNNIPHQMKRYISGGNDAGRIHTASYGTKCLNISLATRYLHSASCVASVSDYLSICDLVYAVLNEFDFNK